MYIISSVYILHDDLVSVSQVISTFTEAVQTVSIEKAVGKPHTLWVEFAKFYESHDQVAKVSCCQDLVQEL